MAIKILGFVCLIFLAFPATVRAATYYAAPNGSGTSCMSTTPCSLPTAVGKPLPGDTVYLKSGTYLSSSSIIITKSGTPTARITFSTAPGEPSLAFISGDINGNGQADPTDAPANDANDDRFFIIRGSYIDITNLEVAYAGGYGVMNYGSNNVISNNKVHDTWYAAIWIFGYPEHAANNIVEYNIVWRAADTNYCGGVNGGRGCNGNWPGGISIGGAYDPAWDHNPCTAGMNCANYAPNTIVRHNTVFHVSGEGILCMQNDIETIEDNIVYDNWGLNIDLDQCSETIVQRNLTYYTKDTNWWRFGDYPSANIMLSSEGNDYTPIQHSVKVINNFMIGGQLKFWGNLSGNALIDTLIANNTIVADQGNMSAIDFDAPAVPHRNTRITNNIIFHSSSLTPIDVANSTSGLTFDHNLWYSTTTPVPAFAKGVGDVYTNPLLTDPAHTRTLGGVIADWYKVTINSPAINAGTNLSSLALGFNNDFWETNRPQGSNWDIGSHEYLSGITPTVTPLPTPITKPGDANGDGKVDGLDLNILISNYGKTGVSGASFADFNADTNVDGLDYVIWLNHYGS